MKKLVQLFYLSGAFLLISCLVGSCRQQQRIETDAVSLTSAWADMTNYITMTTPANSPTFSSRCFGYIGLTMYESVVNGFPEAKSVATQLNDLGPLPKPDPSEVYNWSIALNAAQAEILRSIYIQTSEENKNKIDSLEQLFRSALSANVQDTAIIERSATFGRLIAKQIFEWSKSDGGHRAYLRNFDKKLVFPEKPGGWKPPLYAQSFSHFPLHPHWGQNRTFIPADSAIEAPAFIPFDTVPGSAYYDQFRQVYEKRKILTQEEKETAIWWSDDPDATFTPPGHSYHLATLVIRKTKPDLLKAAETYARVGLAVSDAFRNCWKWKYQFFSERANTYIPEHIDVHWESFWPDPPFPAFPSGHAIQAGATATVLIDLYGDRMEFTDSSHVGRPRDEIRGAEFKARHFTSLWAVAEEIALSRFYGGIHTPQDNARGLEKGKQIGENINQLHWHQ